MYTVRLVTVLCEGEAPATLYEGDNPPMAWLAYLKARGACNQYVMLHHAEQELASKDCYCAQCQRARREYANTTRASR